MQLAVFLLGWLASKLLDSTSPCLHPKSMLGFQAYKIIPGFFMGAWVQTQLFLHGQQAFLPTESSPQPAYSVLYSTDSQHFSAMNGGARKQPNTGYSETTSHPLQALSPSAGAIAAVANDPLQACSNPPECPVAVFNS